MEKSDRIRDIGEVFTPQHIVERMVDLIPDLRIGTTVLEPSVGEGVFLCEILRRKLNSAEAHTPTSCTEALQSIYGVDIMLDNVRKTRANLLSIACAYCGLDPGAGDNKVIVDWKDILKKNIKWGDTLACLEAEVEYNTPPLLFLKDKGVSVCELQFFNYKTDTDTDKWEKHSDSLRNNNDMIEEINKQREEYKKFELPLVTTPPKPTVEYRSAVQ